MSELYQLPNGWEWVKLKDVCDLLNGYAFKAKEYVEHSDTVIIRMGNIRPNGGFDSEHKIKYLPNKYKDELQNYILNDGDLIIAMTDLATEMRILGNPTLVSNTNGRTFMLNQRVGKLHKFNFEKIIIEYLRYILSANQIKDYYKSLGGGGLQINIGKQQILSVDFPLPPLSEQQRIVSKLDLLFEKIDKSIALHQKNMDEADVFMGSVLNDVFGELEEKYGLQSLSSVVKINSGIALPKIFKDVETTNGEYEFFKVAQMNNDDRVMKGADLNFTKEESINHKIKLFPKGSILIPKRGGAILTNKKRILEREASYDSNVMGLKADNKILTDEFLFVFLNSIDLSDYIDTSTIPQINNKHIDMMNISIPPLNIQQKVVKYLDEISEKIEKVKSVQKEKMDSLKALKASILDKAFRGEL